MVFSNKWYDRLKWIQMIFLPAISAAILALNVQWDIPNQDRIVGTIVVVATLMGALLQKSSSDYEGAGDLVITTDPVDGEMYLSADLNEHPDAFKNKANVTLNIRKQDVPAA